MKQARLESLKVKPSVHQVSTRCAALAKQESYIERTALAWSSLRKIALLKKRLNSRVEDEV
jgi:hypothetical protein